MNIKLFLIICVCVIYSCDFRKPQHSTNNILGVWFGGGYEIDEGYYRPISNILHFKKGNILVNKTIGKGLDTLSYVDSLNAFLYINDNKLSDFQIIDNSLLKFRQRSLRTFKKVTTSVVNKSQKEIRALLVNKYWKNKDEVLFFEPDSDSLKRFRTNEEGYLRYCYSVDLIEGISFLLKHGNQSECEGVHQYIEQLVHVSENEYELIRWEDDAFKKLKYVAISKPNFIKNKPTDFQLCNSYLNVNYPIHRYYAVGTAYNGGVYQIKKTFDENYTPPKTKEDGLIRIRFIVNCEGKTGAFEVLEMDKNYKEKKFDEAISTQILKITKELDRWIAGTRKGKFVDSYKFLTFKIRNSEIVEIFP